MILTSCTAYDFLESVKNFDTEFGDLLGINSSFRAACLILCVQNRVPVMDFSERKYLNSLIERLSENAGITASDIRSYLSDDLKVKIRNI